MRSWYQAEHCQRLTSIYLMLRERSHELALNNAGRMVDPSEFEEDRLWVGSLWEEVFAE